MSETIINNIKNFNMKKTILLAGALLTICISMGSCKKDYICECSKTYTNTTSSTTRDYSIYTYTDTRARAENRCNANSSTGADFAGEYSINCQIK